MTSKRIFGFLFIFLAALFSLAIVGQLPDLFRVMAGFVYLVAGKLDAHKGGFVVGQIVFWIVFIIGTIALWKFGLRWSKRRPKESI